MTMTAEEIKAMDMEVYGMDEDRVISVHAKGLKLSGKDMYLASMISDAQYLYQIGENERARKILNQVKKITFDYDYTDDDLWLRERRKKAEG